MSKVCRQCGAAFDDDTRFCTNCGSNDLVSNAPQQNYYAQPTVAKKGNAKLFGIIGIAAAAVVVVILLIVLLGGKSYQSAIDTWFETSVEGNADVVEDLAPGKVLEEKDIDIDDLQDSVEKAWKSNNKSLKKEYGSDYEVSYKILMDKELEENDLEDVAEYIEDEYDIDAEDVTAAYEVIIEVTIEGEDAISVQSRTIDVIKIDGTWYPVNISSNYQSVSFYLS